MSSWWVKSRARFSTGCGLLTGVSCVFNIKCELCPMLCACSQAQLEMQLIERLKNKQMLQRKAYQQLEAVLSLGSR